MKPLDSLDTVFPDLAEKWSWQDGSRNLVFFLRRGVRWHDGQPFTSRDVKFTFDIAIYRGGAHVKNLVPHHTPYSYGRMQEVWLDR